MKKTDKVTDIAPIRSEAMKYIVLSFLNSYDPIIRKANRDFDINDEKDLHDLVTMYKEVVQEQNDPTSILWLIERPYRVRFFKQITNYLSMEDFSMMLEDVWTDSENLSGMTARQWLNCFKKADMSIVYNEDDIEVLRNLPDKFYVYRGINEDRQVESLSWTLSQDIAQWFANRIEENGKVYRALCDKRNVLAYMSSRKEQEIITDWKKLENIEKIDY